MLCTSASSHENRDIARFDPVGKVLALDVLTGFTDKIQDSRDKL